ncbi:hypothetical protein CI610_01054 [invertebrate metagenome]|uniref:Uncharacterized protein n=1 Tax=invertebrate metagenome TaxID=1711999 RepID=A0A2H9T9M6_9ZZZZ
MLRLHCDALSLTGALMLIRYLLVLLKVAAVNWSELLTASIIFANHRREDWQKWRYLAMTLDGSGNDSLLYDLPEKEFSFLRDEEFDNNHDRFLRVMLKSHSETDKDLMSILVDIIFMKNNDALGRQENILEFYELLVYALKKEGEGKNN